MKKSLFLILLAISAWLFSGITGFCRPWYQDPCYTNWTEYTCLSSGSIAITNIAFSPTNVVCLGTPISATAQTSSTDGQVRVDNKYSAPTTNCPNTSWTNPISAFELTNWWVVSMPNGFSASGSGLSAQFTPTNRGSGTIAFYDVYTNSTPCGGSGTATNSKSFTVNQFKVTFADYPRRLDSHLPWSWKATLNAVCQQGINHFTLASMSYEFSIDANCNVSKSKSGDGNVGDVGVIVVSTWKDQKGYTAADEPATGIGIEAYYIGCCDGIINWVQIIEKDTVPLPGDDPCPHPDCGPYTTPPFYYPPGSGFNGVGNRTTDYPQ